MKLAEALMERSDVQKRLAQTGSRLRANALVQEGEKPAEDPRALLAELSALTERLEQLVTAINLTNSSTVIGGETLTALLSRRDARQQKLAALRTFLDAASHLTDRARQSEIRILSTVNVTEMQKELDLESKELRELDARIQEANWTTELAE